MKAWQIGNGYGISSLSVIEKNMPELLPTEVLVQVKAVSLNYRDLLVINGKEERWRPPAGRIPVSDAAGLVISTGADVKTIVKGDRVAGLFLPNWISGRINAAKIDRAFGGAAADGMLQEYIAIEENEVIKIPQHLGYEEAATLPCAGLTAWHGLIEEGNISAGNSVLVQGTGGISLFSLQFALIRGASVIVISGSDDKLERVRAMGVNHLINYNKNPLWENEVLAITNGRGVDHIVEVVGAGHVNKSIEAVVIGGTISLIGLIDGLKGEINTGKIMFKNIKIQGIEVGSKEMFGNMNKAIETHQMRPVVDRIFPFAEAKDAFYFLEKGTHFGKICISF